MKLMQQKSLLLQTHDVKIILARVTSLRINSIPKLAKFVSSIDEPTIDDPAIGDEAIRPATEDQYEWDEPAINYVESNGNYE
ncbi:hypothetical protein L1887_03647 [Cichorium endivia]|nr:hypothetical protein L1887_03647 [Cichorium endivia]